MGKIILVRHGEPDVKKVKMINGLEIEGFLDSYNKANIKDGSKPPQHLLTLAQSCEVVVCSNLNRSLSSCKALGIMPHESNEIFQEANPPYIKTKLLKLSPKSWLIISRAFWLVGYSKYGESLAQTKKRAFQSAQILKNHSKTGDVMLVGHALLNIFIATFLRKNGFKGPKIPAKNFWEYGVYTPKG